MALLSKTYNRAMEINRGLSQVEEGRIFANTHCAEDGINIMIENSWFEEPPRTIDRRELVNDLKH